jgi:NADPH-dependent ferric siderophore reductase
VRVVAELAQTDRAAAQQELPIWVAAEAALMELDRRLLAQQAVQAS